ncbi:hypothetical protein VTK73DRAFT_4916 [Phialemonium thermophilum]|uniref:Uncharacterized protein n=1 Tax=Phialemonium thermophilum TaxID=223376 RepID=A0ABR3V4Y0_9PEZI
MTVIWARADIIAWYERRGYRKTGETRPFPYAELVNGRALRDDLYFEVLSGILYDANVCQACIQSTPVEKPDRRPSHQPAGRFFPTSRSPHQPLVDAVPARGFAVKAYVDLASQVAPSPADALRSCESLVSSGALRIRLTQNWTFACTKLTARSRIG